MNKREFDRSMCFTFFSDWERQAERIAEMYGEDVAYRYLMGIIKYALRQEESDEAIVQLLIEGLKGQIDNSQNRRSRGFGGENVEQTRQIIEYYEEHPEASQNEISKTLGISKGKVNKVIQEYNSGHRSRSIQSLSESLTISEPLSEDNTISQNDFMFDLSKHPKMAAQIKNMQYKDGEM